MIDMHSHILPGLDDGAADWEQSLAMARLAVADGITEMVCTPHWVPGKYDNDRKAILERFAEFEARLVAEEIPLKIHSGAELRIDTTIPARLKAGELLTLDDGNRYVLLELPEETLPTNLNEFFWNLQIAGYRPILSHVERNPVLREQPQRLVNWVEAGILTQITAASLLEEFSVPIREFALLLLRHRLCHMLVTDTHGLRMRSPELTGACGEVEKVLGPKGVEQMALRLPQHILNGEAFPMPDPVPLQEHPGKRGFWSFWRT